MTQDLRHLWSDVVHQAKERFGAADLDVLIENARPVSLDAGTLTIVFPTEWEKDWVEARHLGDLTEIVRQILPNVTEVVLVTQPSNGRSHAPPRYTPPRRAGKTDNETTEVYSQHSNAGNRRSTGTSSRRAQVVTADDGTRSISLNSRYTFDSFVVGPSNRFAQAASLAVAEDPAGAYNPLFLYGGVGLGKTHLMQAIAHYVREHHPSLYVVYVSSETFTNDLINSLRKSSMAEFRRKYRNIDLLLVDDIQFVAGKEQTQEEFFHTFNALYEADKQIVISSDRSPKEIPTLEERLRSRFEWGLTTDIQAPDLETRIAILRKKAELEGITLPSETYLYIASEIQSNIRELEGALIRVVAYASLQGRDVTPETAAEALKDIISSRKSRVITIAAIQEAVASHFGINVEDMKTKKRTRAIAYPRQVAMYLARELTDASLPRIGEEFGGRDHSTVIHACDKIKEASQNGGTLAQTLRELTQKIKNG